MKPFAIRPLNFHRVFTILISLLIVNIQAQAFEPTSLSPGHKSKAYIPCALGEIYKKMHMDFFVIMNHDMKDEHGFLILSEHKHDAKFYIVFFEANKPLFHRLRKEPDYKIGKHDFKFEKKELPPKIAKAVLKKWRAHILEAKFVDIDERNLPDGGEEYNIGISYARYKFARVSVLRSSKKQEENQTLKHILSIWRAQNLIPPTTNNNK